MIDMKESQFIGDIQINCDWKNKIIHLSQPKYMSESLKRFSMELAKPANTPMEVNA